MTTYVLVVVSDNGATVREKNFTRDELITLLQAVDTANDVNEIKIEFDGDMDRVVEKVRQLDELSETLVEITADWTDWDDIDPDGDIRRDIAGE